MKNIWRIYRLPGSREHWHVDSGEGTQILNILGWEILCPSKSVDVGTGVPHSWIEINKENSELHLIGGKGLWTVAAAAVDREVSAPTVAL